MQSPLSSLARFFDAAAKELDEKGLDSVGKLEGEAKTDEAPAAEEKKEEAAPTEEAPKAEENKSDAEPSEKVEAEAKQKEEAA